MTPFARASQRLLFVVVVAGCSAAVQPDEEPMIEIPLPAGAVKVDLSTADGVNAGDYPTAPVYPLQAIERVRAVVDAEGHKHVAFDAVRHSVSLICTDFGCSSWWGTSRFPLCLNLDATPTPAAGPECERARAIALDVSPPDPDALKQHLAAAVGSSAVTVTWTGGTTLSTSADSRTVEWTGGAQTEFPLDEAFGDWLSSGANLKQPWAIRATFVEGRLIGAPVVEPALGGLEHMASLTVAEDAQAARALLVKTRDSGLVALDVAPGPMTGRFVGQGYHLYPDPQWSRSDTVGAFVVGDTLVELFLAPGEKTLSMLNSGANMGGSTRPGDLYVHVRKAENGTPGPLHPFTLLHARSNAPGTAVACLDRPYDPASLTSATASIEPEVAVLGIEPSFSPACVTVRLGAAAADVGHRLVLGGLKDLAGHTLPPTGATFLGAGGGLVDVAASLTGRSGSNQAVLALFPLANGGLLGELGPGGALPSGLVEWGPDLFTYRLLLPPSGGTVVGRVYDPAHARVWLMLQVGSVNHVASYDGRTLREYLPAEHPRLAGINEMRLLGDGTLAVGSNPPLARIDGETITEYPGNSAMGVVLGSSDFIESSQGRFTQKKADGTEVRSFRLGDAWAGVNTVASEGGVDYACSSQGFFRIDGETGTALTIDGTRIYSCTSMQPLLGGGLSVRIPTGGYIPILLQIRGDTIRNVLRFDPLLPESAYRYVYDAFERAPNTYFWAIGDFGNDRTYPASLRITDRASYDALFEGVWP